MPLLLEPVKASISFKNIGNYDMFVLNHDGVVTNQEVPINNNSVFIDGEKYRTIYYLLVQKL